MEENATDWNTIYSKSTEKPSGEYSTKIPIEETSPLKIVGWESGQFVSLKAGYGATIE